MPRPMKPLRSRGGLTYEKSALTEAELLERWIERGLVLVDQERAARYVRHIGYYRLSAYVRTFEAGERDVLRAVSYTHLTLPTSDLV